MGAIARLRLAMPAAALLAGCDVRSLMPDAGAGVSRDDIEHRQGYDCDLADVSTTLS